MRKPGLLLKTILSNLEEDEVGDIAWVSSDISAETLNLSSLKTFMPLLRVDPLHQILANTPHTCTVFSSPTTTTQCESNWSQRPSGHKYPQKLRGKLFLPILAFMARFLSTVFWRGIKICGYFKYFQNTFHLRQSNGLAINTHAV